MQEDPKAMLIKDWIIVQSKDPPIREIKYLINNKRLNGGRYACRIHKSPNYI